MGQEADLSFLNASQGSNVLQLLVVREHHKLEAQEEVKSYGKELVMVHSQ